MSVSSLWCHMTCVCRELVERVKEIGRQLVAAQPSGECACIMYSSILCVIMYTYIDV